MPVRKRPRGLGVAVLLGYTLRLLTLAQPGCAAALIRAPERLRQQQPGVLGNERFSFGLWVGRSATANTIDQALEDIRSYRAQRGPNRFPLPSCPWCRSVLNSQCLFAEPSKKPERIIVGCSNVDCPFAAGNNPEGIPALEVGSSSKPMAQRQ